MRISYPPDLPVSARRDDIAAAIRDHQVVIVAGETGSGKTTQLPKVCLELERGLEGRRIGHTQPRRIAARSVAERIAAELDSELGDVVGYQVRFTDKTSPQSRIKLMTDGILLAELQHDRMLRKYDTIIIDEAHERSLNIDFLLGYLRQLLPKRPDLKLIITSATIDPDRFAEHFAIDGTPAPIIEVSGRTYPVEIRYRPLVEYADDHVDGEGETVVRDQTEAIQAAVEELSAEGPGDILVFLPGEREIRDTAEALADRDAQLGPGRGADVLPLYGRLSAAEQHRVFAPGKDSRRRIVLATNVAETSLTVPGIRYVVDTGVARISRFSARTKVQRLPIEPISQASANQRSGRCGRVAAGVAIRLYSEEDFEGRPEFTDPEILRTNLASVMLQMAALGLGDMERFPFVEPPDRRNIKAGEQLLEELGALRATNVDSKGHKPRLGTPQPSIRRLSKVGKRLARLPVDPRLGRMLVEAERLGCVRDVLVIVAALSLQDPRERPEEQRAQADQLHARFKAEGSDFLTWLNLWRHLREQQRELSGSAFRRMCRAEYLNYLRVREWQELEGQLRQVCKEMGLRLGPPESGGRGAGTGESGGRGARAGEPGGRGAGTGESGGRGARAGGSGGRGARAGEPGGRGGRTRAAGGRGGRSATVTRPQDAGGGTAPYDADGIHQALLSGLLSHVGVREEREAPTGATNGRPRGRKRPGPREYLGARGAKFAIFPGSGLARQNPPYLMAAELVETSRLWARQNAEIRPEWAERLGSHLVKRTYSEPTWSQKRASVVARERVTLYGVPLVTDRPVNYGRIDPELSRLLFIRHALVYGEWRTRHDFFHHNRALLAEAEELEHRARRRDLVVDEHTLFDFYDARIGTEVVSGAHFDQWWKQVRRDQPDLLTFDPAMLTHDTADEVAGTDYPDQWISDGLTFDLRYHFEPGAEDDGVTVDIPVGTLNRVADQDFSWHVPGLREELVVALLRGLPKQLRVHFVPAPNTARAFLAATPPGEEPLLVALERYLRATTGIAVPHDAWDPDALPAHLRPTYRVVDDSGTEQARGKDLDALKAPLQPEFEQAMAEVASDSGVARTGETTWVFGEIEEASTWTRAGHEVAAHPGLVDEGDTVGLQVFGSADERDARHRLGVARLVDLPSTGSGRSDKLDQRQWASDDEIIAGLSPAEKLALAGTPYPSVAALLADCRRAVVLDAVDARPPVRTEQEYAALRADRERTGSAALQALLAEVLRVLERWRETDKLLGGRTEMALLPALADLQGQLGRLVHDGFIGEAGSERLRRYPTYLAAMRKRREKLDQGGGAVRRDQELLDRVQPLQEAYLHHLEALPAGRPPGAALRRVRWLLEEYRVSLWAPELGTAEKVSDVRLRKALDEA